MIGVLYKFKKDLKKSVGKPLKYVETSIFAPEYNEDGTFAVVGPSPYVRKWYAQVTMKDGLIQKVS